MTKVILLVVALSVGASLISAAPVCTNCILLCFETAAVCLAAGPLGSAACFIFCEALCVASCFTPLCVHGNTTVTVQRPGVGVVSLPARAVVIGDYVQTAEPVTTQAGTHELWTPITRNTKLSGEVHFVNIVADSYVLQVRCRPLAVHTCCFGTRIDAASMTGMYTGDTRPCHGGGNIGS